MTEGPGQGALAIDERPSEKSERSARRADALTGRWGAWPWLLALVVVASMLPIGLGAVSAAPAGAPSIGGAFSAPTVHPAAASNCYPMTPTACAVAAPGYPNILPTPGQHFASVEPNATDNIVLYIYAETQLIYPNAPPNGVHAPLAINVTGTLWNGNPYFCVCDGTVWHANSVSTPYYSEQKGLEGQNKTYPYVYELEIWNRSTGGTPNVFSGETIYWHVHFVYYSNTSGKYTQNDSPTLGYRIAGAWAYSPWPGAVQYGGPNASVADLLLHWNPLTPNWDDSVNISIHVTTADVANRTAIGWATLFIQLYDQGTPVGNVTEVPFVIAENGVSGLKGNESSNQTIPNAYTQIAGDDLVFWVEARDTASYQNDTISLPPVTVHINPNGTWQQGVFDNDVAVTTNPPSVLNSTLLATTPVLAPGTNVTVTITSRSPTTSILSAEILYSFSYPLLPETVSTALPMDRINSTTFRATIPGMPLTSFVNFTILALDYAHDLDKSATFSYATDTFDQYVPSLPQNETFFYVYVYDNQSSSYLGGVIVQIHGPTPAVNTISNSRYGIAYTNSTGNDFVPLLVAANVTYNISITGVTFLGQEGSHTIAVNLAATHVMSDRRTLARGATYIVVQEGNSVFFWVNGTLPATVFSPAAPTESVAQVGAILGLAGGLVMAFVLWRWFAQIQARRKEEEKRVTL